MAETKRELLPSDALPEHYDLTLEPDIEKFAFDGVVKITCDVQARGPGSDRSCQDFVFTASHDSTFGNIRDSG